MLTTEDGLTRVTLVRLNGVERIRVEQRSNVLVHGRAAWYFLGDVRTMEDVAQYVPLEALRPA